jgi:flavin prenyltransferase
MEKKMIIGISGASGTIYAIKLIEALLIHPIEIHLIISEMGGRMLAHELKIRHEDISGFFSGMSHQDKTNGKIILYDCNDMFAPMASGSFLSHAMAIVPCSMKTLSAVASGYTTNLLERAADVTLKEKRVLILVPRETPLSHVHLKNLLAAHEAGATIMPASPGFYHHPQTVDELVWFMVGRMMDHLKIEHPNSLRWGNP